MVLRRTRTAGRNKQGSVIEKHLLKCNKIKTQEEDVDMKWPVHQRSDSGSELINH